MADRDPAQRQRRNDRVTKASNDDSYECQSMLIGEQMNGREVRVVVNVELGKADRFRKNVRDIVILMIVLNETMDRINGRRRRSHHVDRLVSGVEKIVVRIDEIQPLILVKHIHFGRRTYRHV